MIAKLVNLDGKEYAIIPREEYERLTTLAKAANLPTLPAADAEGNFPAVDLARASLARKIIRKRAALGISQAELARLAGMQVATLCRIETGKCTPSTNSIAKIEQALSKAAKHNHSAKG